MPIINIDEESYDKLYKFIDKSFFIQLFQKIKYRTIFPILLLAKRDKSIIDIGCAKGNFLRFLKSHGFSNLSGLDIKNCLYEDLLNNVTFYEKSICTEQFDLNTKFDNVIVQNMLHHVPVDKLETTAVNLSNLLKEGGILFIHEPNMGSIIGRFMHQYFLKFYPELQKATMKEKNEQFAFCAAWPNFIKNLKDKGIIPMKESNYSFYKVFIGRKLYRKNL
jgi:2-polyprenyl-3-methyl-5-hydroxy-6-metoxy-1,4-benzoquinol methylase